MTTESIAVGTLAAATPTQAGHGSSTAVRPDDVIPAGDAPDVRPLTDVCFENFSLHPMLLKGLEEAGFIRCTPIQALTLPIALAGKDVAGQAQTGTGKTLAFLVTIINRLMLTPAHPQRSPNDPRSIVLAPTRELAIQIEKDARAISQHTGLRFALIYGGVDYDKQRELLRGGVDVVIATPGRLIDYHKQHVVELRGIDIVVLDEADRMFDLGFIKDIRFLLRRMPPREERQSMLFSATLSQRVLELAYEHMHEAQKITVETEFVTADRVRQQVFFPANDEKLPLLIGLLSRMDAQRTMVFVNTKVWCEKVARALERAHFRVAVLSGDVPQVKREKLLAKFKKGELDILVATDVAARGLHIVDVSHVFNYDLPFDAEDYVHRIGRTARLGAEGDAISFACELYAMSLPDIEKFIGQKIPVGTMDLELLQPVHRTPLVRSTEPEVEDPADAARATRGPPPKHGGAGGRGRPGSSGSRSDRGGSRSGADRSGGRGAGERRPRAEPRKPHEGEAAASVAPRAPHPQRAHPPGAGAAPAEGEAVRRRRRGGRGRGRGGENLEAVAPVAAREAPAPVPVAAAPVKLLGRIKQGIKSMINRLPVPGRRR